MKSLKTVISLFLIACCITDVAAQQKPVSPLETATGKINGANVSITYSAPSVKNREIWGALVPFDKMWRAGANAATVFTTDKDVTVEGKALPAGSYAFFVIPGKEESTIIFNKVAVQRGTSEYKQENDQLRVVVKQQLQQSSTEKLTYDINGEGVTVKWANWNIPIRIK